MKRLLPFHSMKKNLALFVVLSFFIFFPLISSYGQSRGLFPRTPGLGSPFQVFSDSISLILKGRQIFRYDTFGDQAFWGDELRLHEAIAGENLGGVGSGVSPLTALGVGLKVDSQALPFSLRQQIRRGEVNLEDPATTLALLNLNAVVGVTGFFDDNGTIESIGIQCALCHSTVDDSLLPGIGNRLDGWANRDLNVGAIIALAPDLTFFTDLLGLTDQDQDAVRTILRTWGPGKFDAHLLLDGQSIPTLIPPRLVC